MKPFIEGSDWSRSAPGSYGSGAEIEGRPKRGSAGSSGRVARRKRLRSNPAARRRRKFRPSLLVAVTACDRLEVNRITSSRRPWRRRRRPGRRAWTDGPSRSSPAALGRLRRIRTIRSTHAGCMDSRYGLKRIRPRRRPRFRRPSAGSPEPARPHRSTRPEARWPC